MTPVCIPHLQRGCLICNPQPAQAAATLSQNRWHRDGDGWLRHDEDGTVWTIKLAIAGGVDLAMVYRDHRLRSHHDNVTAAKRHHGEMVAAWRAQSLRAWMSGRRG